VNVVDVEVQLVAIAAQAHTDPLAAADRERRMCRDVLLAIARGERNADGLARAALRSWELEFSRHK
jgi:hypothetical protein